MNGRTLASLGVSAGDKVRVSGAAGAIELEAALDEAVADRAVRVAAAFEQTAASAVPSVKSAWSVSDGMA